MPKAFAALALAASLFFAPAQPAVSYVYLPFDTALYSGGAGSYEEVVTLPATYFAARLNTEEQNGYILVSYLDLTGFIKSGETQSVDYEPRYKYAEVSFTVQNDGQPAKLRSAPDHGTESNVLLTMPDGARGRVYGERQGTALIGALGGKWYYVSYQSGTSVKYGYVYSGQVGPVAFPENVIEPMPVDPETPPDKQPSSPYLQLGSAAEILIVAALTIPAVAVMLLLFKRPKNKRSTRSGD